MSIYESVSTSKDVITIRRKKTGKLCLVFETESAPYKDSGHKLILKNSQGKIIGNKDVSEGAQEGTNIVYTFAGLDVNDSYSLIAKIKNCELPIFENKKYGEWK